jgi:multiple antibiotic resistance protein
VFPLAMPLIAGPGALTGMILLTSKHSGDLGALVEVHVVLVVMLALTWALFRAGGMIERLLGATGVVVVTRLLGILLAALAVQFVLDGLRAVGAIGAAT